MAITVNHVKAILIGTGFALIWWQLGLVQGFLIAFGMFLMVAGATLTVEGA